MHFISKTFCSQLITNEFLNELEVMGGRIIRDLLWFIHPPLHPQIQLLISDVT